MTSTTQKNQSKFIFKARASNAGLIMTNSRTKGEVMGKTGQKAVQEAYMQWKYKRRKFIQTNAMAKGTECENEAVMIYNIAMGTDYKKTVYHGDEKMENDRATGHEDLDSELAGTPSEVKHTIDIKTCADIHTFPMFGFEAEKIYQRQGQVYMMLKGEDYVQHTVAKVLVNTPLWIIRNELYNIGYRVAKQFEGNDAKIDKETDKRGWQYFKNNVYDKQVTAEHNGNTLVLSDDLVIPYKERVVCNTFYRDEKMIQDLKDRVDWINNEYLPSLGI